MPTLSTIGAACARAWGFTSGLVKDQYFNLVSLLLPGNGTDGKQNRTFKDSSVNDFLITPNGNATQGTFSPFSQTGWGAYFDGSNDYLGLSTQSILPTGTLEFTIEFWAYKTNAWATGTQAIITDGGSAGIEIWVDTGNSVLRLGRNGIAAVLDYSYASLTVNSWNHFAYSRKGNDFALWVNGTRVATTTNSNSFATSNGTQAIGAFSAGSSPWAGYLASVRVVRGSYVYDTASSNIPVPTSPLTAVTNTTLLTCQYNRFRDASTNNFTVTPNNGAAITPFSPFAPTQSYSASAVGGSGYFDGTGDYLTVGYNANLQLGSSDFTIDFWFYSTGAQGSGDVLANGYTSGTNLNWLIQADVSTVKFYASTNGTAWAVSALTVGTIVHNQWNHFCVTRSGTTVTPYLNGTAGTTGSLTGSVFSNSSGIAIATDNSSPGTLNIQGYLSDFRIIIGSAVAPPSGGPTSPATAVTNTKLLLNFTNAGVVDATAKNVLETVGNAQISTTQSKWGGGSMLFNGTTDYLKPPPSPFYAFGTGDFTIECWVRFSSTTVSNGQGICQIDTAYLNSTLSGPAIGTGDPSGKWGFFIGTTAYEATSLIPSINTWYHVAMVRYSGTTKLYVDGTAVPGLSQADTNNYTKQYLTIGGWFGTGNLLDGYIDDFRVSRFARYTSNFTAPSAPFPVQ